MKQKKQRCKSAEAYYSPPPNLTDSESESDSESEPESDQECIVGEISLRYQLGSAPDVTNNANASEIGSRKAYLEDDNDPTMVARDKKENTEKPVLVQVKTLEKCVAIQERYN